MSDADLKMTAQPMVALVSFDSLGDSLIYISMASNLNANGYRVTLFGDIPYHMGDWLPDLDIRPYPPEGEWDRTLDRFDLAIVCPPTFIRNQMDQDLTTKLLEKWVLICQRAPEAWHLDHSARARNIEPAKNKAISNLLNCGGSIRYKLFRTESVVDISQEYMREKMRLTKVNRLPPVRPPEGLQHRRYPKRIIISPDSAGPENKNWRPRGFLELAMRLRDLGYDPVIVVAPKHHSYWKDMPGNIFNTPKFDNVGSLSSYLYESGLVVANDSGNGHLASFLNIPVVTIYRKRNPKFHWRPDWGPGKVVCPIISLPFQNGRLWKYLVSVNQVIKAIDELLNQNTNLE